MFMEKETPKVSPARYFHTGAIMTPFIIHGIMGNVRSAVYSRARPIDDYRVGLNTEKDRKGPKKTEKDATCLLFTEKEAKSRR